MEKIEGNGMEIVLEAVELAPPKKKPLNGKKESFNFRMGSKQNSIVPDSMPSIVTKKTNQGLGDSKLNQSIQHQNTRQGHYFPAKHLRHNSNPFKASFYSDPNQEFLSKQDRVIKQQVYLENKSFFKELITEPCTRHGRQVDNEVIMNAVYGPKFNSKGKIGKVTLGGTLGGTLGQQSLVEQSTQAGLSKQNHEKALQSIFDSTSNESENESQRLATDEFLMEEPSLDQRRLVSDLSKPLSFLPQVKDRSLPHHTPPIKNMHLKRTSLLSESQASDCNPFFGLKKNLFAKRIGEQEIQDYYKRYKMMKQSVEAEENKAYGQVAYLQECDRKQIAPRTYGLVTYKGQEDVVEISNFLMGNQYSGAYSKGLQLLKAKKLSLGHNRLTSLGSLNILKGINSQVEELDLRGNKMGEESINYLCTILEQVFTYNLRDLNLEQTGIGDAFLSQLLSTVSASDKPRLRVLNMAKNSITDSGAEKAGVFLASNDSVKDLNLYWNKIRAKGGLAIAEGLAKNKTLKLLDLSWNQCGLGKVLKDLKEKDVQKLIKELLKQWKVAQTDENYQEQLQKAIDEVLVSQREQNEELIGRSWGQALADNKSLIHLDLSYNSFSLTACTQIQTLIQKNHSLYGIHLSGNCCSVDSKGFLDLNSYNKRQISEAFLAQSQTEAARQKGNSPQLSSRAPSPNSISNQVKKKIGHLIEPRGKKESGIQLVTKASFPASIPSSPTIKTPLEGSPARKKAKHKDNCWICESWTEVKFEYRTEIGAKVCIHFDFDNYEPDLLTTTSAGTYQLFRMVPPGIHHYFFSVNGKVMLNPNHPSLPLEAGNKLVLFLKANIERLMLRGDLNEDQQAPALINLFEANNQRQLLNRETFDVSIKNCLPRTNKKFTKIDEERPRTPWTFPISLFKPYRPETQTIVKECFEFDWSCMKKPPIKKSSVDDIKEKMRDLYPFLREVYKRLSAIGLKGAIFSIGLNTFTDFITKQLNIDDKDGLSEYDRLFITVNGNKRSELIPANALVRFQFVEIMLRLAVKKYFETGEAENEVEAIEIFAQRNVWPLWTHHQTNLIYLYNQQRWRDDRYWNEACDNILKAFAPLFQHLFNSFGGTHKKPGQKHFMTVDEFEGLVGESGLVNDLLNQRELALFFNLAMMTQVNEIEENRHLQGSYVEFLEAMSRVCDEASMVSANYQSVDTLDENQQMTTEERRELPLHIKIENAIPLFLKNCTGKGFTERFEFPRKDPIVGLYILPNKKFF